MSLPRKDLIATVVVAAAVVLYLLWAVERTLPGMSETQATAAAVLALGFVASAIAVVPGFDQLIHGSKAYLTTTATLGLVALVVGAQALLTSSGVALTIVMVLIVLLWAISTGHHVALARPTPSPTPTRGKIPEHAGRHSR